MVFTIKFWSPFNLIPKWFIQVVRDLLMRAVVTVYQFILGSKTMRSCLLIATRWNFPYDVSDIHLFFVELN